MPLSTDTGEVPAFAESSVPTASCTLRQARLTALRSSHTDHVCWVVLLPSHRDSRTMASYKVIPLRKPILSSLLPTETSISQRPHSQSSTRTQRSSSCISTSFTSITSLHRRFYHGQTVSFDTERAQSYCPPRHLARTSPLRSIDSINLSSQYLFTTSNPPPHLTHPSQDG